ncbi:MAG: HEAT repeat domain-containing protein [Methylacidiphilales bacterium]|nr:HEAT repeat domain-containing protein [Candidatus Methylacidiphilales bacterium]
MTQTPIEKIEINLRAEALNQRKAALDELAEFPPEVAIAVLNKLAKENDFGLRRLAVMGLGNHKSAASFQALQNILENEKDDSVLAEAANSIFEFGDTAIPEIVKLFEKSHHWLVRQTVISLLIETEYYEALMFTAKIALQDETQTVKEAGILALGQLLQSQFENEVLDILTELAQDADWRSRWRVAIALQHSQQSQAQVLIAKLQQDEHYRVVAAALEVAASWDNT